MIYHHNSLNTDRKQTDRLKAKKTMIDNNSTKNAEAGFTIIELMIATAVLATILLLVTVLMISIGNLYYKGINTARVQDDVRSAVDDVSQNLEFDGATPTPTSSPISYNGIPIDAYCIGTTRYSYIIGVQQGTGNDTDNQSTPRIAHVLWQDTISNGGTTCPPANLAGSDPSTPDPAIGATLTGTNGTELIAPNSRLTAFCIAGSSGSSSGSICFNNVISPYTVSIGMAYGDADLLNISGRGVSGVNINTECRGGTGDQFCSTASLTTSVTERL